VIRHRHRCDLLSDVDRGGRSGLPATEGHDAEGGRFLVVELLPRRGSGMKPGAGAFCQPREKAQQAPPAPTGDGDVSSPHLSLDLYRARALHSWWSPRGGCRDSAGPNGSLCDRRGGDSRDGSQHRPAELTKSPAPLVHAVTKVARRAFYEAYSWFVAAFRTVAEALKAGDRGAPFPAGSFPPGLTLRRRLASPAAFFESCQPDCRAIPSRAPGSRGRRCQPPRPPPTLLLGLTSALSFCILSKVCERLHL
jgi:hypothetical protein